MMLKPIEIIGYVPIPNLSYQIDMYAIHLFLHVFDFVVTISKNYLSESVSD